MLPVRPIVLVILLGFVQPLPASDSETVEYRCASDWNGPTIAIRGEVIPLPKGYSLRDGSSNPHAFTNVGRIQEPPGQIYIGSAPGFVESYLDLNDKEFSYAERRWRGARRISARHLVTGLNLEVFEFERDVVIAFNGSSTRFAEALAECLSDRIAESRVFHMADP